MTQSPEEAFAQAIRETLRKRDELSEQLASMYQDREAVKRCRCLVVRCPTGCLVLDVWKVAGILAGYQPPYRLSPAMNERTSSESGRSANTVDGDRRWKAQTYSLENARGWDGHNLNLVCDHVNVSVLTADVLAMADGTPAGRPRRVRVAIDGTFR